MEDVIKDILPQHCYCNKKYYILGNGLSTYISRCPYCSKQVIQLESPRCQSGFSFPEEANKIDPISQQWKCETCQ